jgi:hypothetical protein
MLLPLTSPVARQPFRLSSVTMEIGAGSSINPAKAAFVPFGCLPPSPGTRLTAPAGSHKSNHPTLLLNELLNLIPLKRIIKNQTQKSSESTVIYLIAGLRRAVPKSLIVTTLLSLPAIAKPQ